jgi:uncharacterized protein (TIGR03118 family)
MRNLTQHVAVVSLVGFFLASAATLRADALDGKHENAFIQTNLVSGMGPPPNTTPAPPAENNDPQLLNAWGIAFFPNGPIWVNDNASGFSTLYDGEGMKQVRVIRVPPSPGKPPGSIGTPTGIVWNIVDGHPDRGFLIPEDKGGNGGAALFIFDSEDGTITAWNDGTDAIVVVDNFNVPPSNKPALNGSVYKGLAFGTNAAGNFLYASNFRQARVDVFDNTFTQTQLDGSFDDPQIAPGYAPFGIQNINGQIWVTYAKQDAEREDDVAGRGNGFVNVFDTDGHLVRRFAARGALNAPWGLALAPFGFGSFGGDILIGNFGDGHINVYAPNGDFVDQLNDTRGKTIKIEGLWGLSFGGGLNSSPQTLYFSAGPGDEANGLFGRIDPQDMPKEAGDMNRDHG